MQKLSIKDRFQLVRENVEHLLALFPETRNDDFLLVLKYWEMFDGVRLNIPEKVRNALTRYTTITRRKQEVQNDEKKFATDIPSPHKYKKLGEF